MGKPRIYFPKGTSDEERRLASAAITESTVEDPAEGVLCVHPLHGGEVVYERCGVRCRDCYAIWMVWARQDRDPNPQLEILVEGVFRCPVCRPDPTELGPDERIELVRALAKIGTDVLAEMAIEVDRAQLGGELTQAEIAESVRAAWHHPDDVAEIDRLRARLLLLNRSPYDAVGFITVTDESECTCPTTRDGITRPEHDRLMMACPRHGLGTDWGRREP